MPLYPDYLWRGLEPRGDLCVVKALRIPLQEVVLAGRYLCQYIRYMPSGARRTGIVDPALPRIYCELPPLVHAPLPLLSSSMLQRLPNANGEIRANSSSVMRSPPARS